MTIIQATDRARWEAFLGTAQPPTFLQSWAWGETQQRVGEDVIRLLAEDHGHIVGAAQAVTVTARRGRFLHVPHGPIVLGGRQILSALVRALHDEARRQKYDFLRVSPAQANTEGYQVFYRERGFRPAPIYLHAENLWVLDVTPPEDLLLAQMRKTTRNLVRRAEREGVTVRLSSDPTDMKTFLALYLETASREGFTPFPEALLSAELHAFGPEDAVIGLASACGRVQAAAIVVYTPWGGFYHHGGSTRRDEHIPASQALQWALIRETKRRGCREYNFWGIYPSSNKRFGITVFKTGFGGREMSLVPTQDAVLSWRYWPTYCLETARRLRRGL